MQQQDVKIDIGELFRFILQGLLPALLIGGAAAYLALQLANRQEPVYEAQATVLAAQTNSGPRDFGLPSISAPPLDVEAYRTAATTDPVLADALERMGLSEPVLSDIRGLRGDIRVQAQDTRSSSLIHVFGQGATPSAASNRANAVANALVDWDRQRASAGIVRSIEQLESTIASLTDQIRALQTMNDPSQSDQIVGLISRRAEAQEQLSYARAMAASATPLLTVIQPASPPGGSGGATAALQRCHRFLPRHSAHLWGAADQAVFGYPFTRCRGPRSRHGAPRAGRVPKGGPR